VVPPFDDSAKNIVVSQVRHGGEHRYRVLGTPSSPPPAPGVAVDPIYPDGGAFSPGLKQNLRVMWHGMRPRGADLYHYFFAPNRISSMAGRAQRLVARVRTVQTVCSKPRTFDGIAQLLFTDKVIVLSQDTLARMVKAGVPARKLALVPPGIDPLDAPNRASRRAIRAANGVSETRPVVLFPGDYQFSSAAETVARAVPLLARLVPNVQVVFACRIKQEASKTIRDRIRADIARQGLDDKVVFLERVREMPSFVGAADIVVMPAESLYAKMDVPLVLLEAMSQGVPLVVADVPPLNELLVHGCGVGVPPGDPEAPAEAVARLLDDRAAALKLGRAGQAAVRDVYSAEAMAHAVEKVYSEVLEP
jgi:glycosyltransferase involved in cell wall biosynthesis